MVDEDPVAMRVDPARLRMTRISWAVAKWTIGLISCTVICMIIMIGFAFMLIPACIVSIGGNRV